MIDLTKVPNYYIACGYTDLRLGIDGLAAVVTQQYGSHLDEESLFLFCGRRTDRIKALYWYGDGYILLYKRLSNGRFQWPRSCVPNRLRTVLELLHLPDQFPDVFLPIFLISSLVYAIYACCFLSYLLPVFQHQRLLIDIVHQSLHCRKCC